MTSKLDTALEVLRENGISYDDLPFPELPDIGKVTERETIYSTSLSAVESGGDELFERQGSLDNDVEPTLPDDPDYRRKWSVLQDITLGKGASSILEGAPQNPPEPACAWYCPIHYFGHAWGIYIRQSCILSAAIRIAAQVDWILVKRGGMAPSDILRQLLRAGFYSLFLHEQFHHKVESLGFRILVATGSDRYRPYKANVYRPAFLTASCLEESLANAESYLRLGEDRYKKKLSDPFRDALRTYLKLSFAAQPPGYREALNFLTDADFASGKHYLQSSLLDGKSPPSTPSSYWIVAPDVIRALMNIESEIYVILPAGASPLFKPSSIDPGYVVSTDEAKSALVKNHGYREVSGGKGSHVKLTKPGAPPIVLTGNQDALSPGVLKDVLRKLGGHPLSRARAVLEGRL